MMFERHVGIDYSGAQTAEASLKGIRVYLSEKGAPPEEVPPPPSPRLYWTRAGLALWLEGLLAQDRPTLVGIDHGFSFPLRYFETHRLPPDWDLFLDDFQRHWPTDEANTYVDFIRRGMVGDGAARGGNSRWRRLTEERSPRAKSVFHFDVPGSVAKSTHAGLPWLRRIRRNLGDRVFFWPFDGWDIPPGRSVVAEAYPALWNGSYPREERSPDQQDAYCLAAHLAELDRQHRLSALFRPDLTASEATTARIEGWILGII